LTIAVTRKGTNQTESSEAKIVTKSDGLRQSINQSINQSILYYAEAA